MAHEMDETKGHLLLNTLIETAPVLIVLTDPDGRITLFNRTCEELTGYHRSEVIGKTIPEMFLPTEWIPLVLKCFANPYAPELLAPHEIPWKTKSGGERLIEWRCTALSSPGHGKPCILGIGIDITTQKKMEKELIKTRQIESIGVLAGGIAHDFNNVLTAILGNISLAKIPLNPEDTSYARLTEAEKAIMRAKDLTNQLITFSKGGAPVKEIASVQEIIKDSANFALPGSSVSCRFSFADDLWPADVDKGQVSQVIHNMIINAEQAMPEGGIIQVQCENVMIDEKIPVNLRPGRYIRVCIEDKGVGIPQESLSRIFDPYFTTKQKGSGFGLTTSFSIIKKHEGIITVDSKPGIGTAFCVYLPAAYEKTSAKEEGGAGIVAGKGRILLMDDEEIIREVAAQMLKHIGYHVETAADGAEAIALYQKEKESEQPFDAVILDLTIPGGMGGKETLARLMEINPDIKAIVSSGYSDDPVMSDFKIHGFRGSLAKPYRMEEMSNALQRALGRELTV